MVAVSIQDIKHSPQDLTAYYLDKIYKLQLHPNITPSYDPLENLLIPSALDYAVTVNSLWFSSLLTSLTTAVLAISVQHWARQYIKVTQPAQYIPHKRARVRAFVAGGFSIPLVIELLSAMVHLYLLLFIAGLLRYLSYTHRVVFLATCGCAFLLPFVRLWLVITSSRWLGCSPYTIIFSIIDLVIVDVVIYGAPKPGRDPTHPEISPPGAHMLALILLVNLLGCCLAFLAFLSSSSRKRAEEDSRQPLVIDTHILNSTLDRLAGDETREKFFESIPGFYRSEVIKDLQRYLPTKVKSKIHLTLVDFFCRTLVSNTIPGLAKSRRLAICITAADDTDTSTGSVYNFAEIIYQYWHAMPQSVEFGGYLGSWDRWGNGRYAQWIIANIVAKKDERDDRWMALAMDYLGISQHVLQDYLSHGDSIQIAILTHSIRHAIRTSFSSFRLLPPLSGFDALNTLPRLQHEFCDLWNTLVQNSRGSEDPSSSISILKATRHIYVALHQGTDAAPTGFSASTKDVHDVLNQPSSYPLCNIPDHLPNSIPSIHSPVAISTPPLPVSESHPGDSTPHPADKSSLGNRPAQIIQSFHPSYHVPPPSARAPVDPVPTASTRTIVHPSAISASVTHDPRSTPAMTGVIDSPQPDSGYDAISISVASRTPISPPVSLPDEALALDLQSRSTYVTVVSQSDRSPVVLGDHPPNLVPITPPAVHQGTPILDSDIALDITELFATNYSQDADTPPTVAPHSPHSITSDPGITRELSAYPPGIEPSHDFDRSR